MPDGLVQGPKSILCNPRARLAPERLGGTFEGYGTPQFATASRRIGDVQVARSLPHSPFTAPVVASGVAGSEWPASFCTVERSPMASSRSPPKVFLKAWGRPPLCWPPAGAA